jgi:hypothetical protein
VGLVPPRAEMWRGLLERGVACAWRLASGEGADNEPAERRRELEALLTPGVQHSRMESLTDDLIAATIYALQAYELGSPRHAAYAGQVALDTVDLVEGFKETDFPPANAVLPLLAEEEDRQARAVSLLSESALLEPRQLELLRAEARRAGVALAKRLQD